MSLIATGHGIIVADAREHLCADGKAWLEILVDVGTTTMPNGRPYHRRAIVWTQRPEDIHRAHRFYRGERIRFTGRAGGITRITAYGKHYSYPLVVIGEVGEAGGMEVQS